jgi:hypothetical protein
MALNYKTEQKNPGERKKKDVKAIKQDDSKGKSSPVHIPIVSGDLGIMPINNGNAIPRQSKASTKTGKK